MSKYVVVDLEMCPVPSKNRKIFRSKNEIIQIGAVLVDEEYEIIDTFSCFVRPQFGKLDSFIKELTGIRWQDLSAAPPLQDALLRFLEWLPEESVIAVAWSDSDRYQLCREIREKQLSPDKMDGRIVEWVDCQALFAEKLAIQRNYALQEALIATDISTAGRAHNGADDAYNTALLFRKIQTEEEIRLNPWFEEAHQEKDSSALQFTLGELLQGLNLHECIAG